MPRNPFKRSVEVPRDVLETAQLARRERVLAAAVAADGTWLLGTHDALLVLGPPRAEQVAAEEASARVEPARIPWQCIEKADWDRDTEKLHVVEVAEFGRPRPEHTFEVDDSGHLLELLRERVTASVVLQRRVNIYGKRGLFVIARRPPRRDGEITWAYELDPGVDPDDPRVMEAAQRALDSAADDLGL